MSQARPPVNFLTPHQAAVKLSSPRVTKDQRIAKALKHGHMITQIMKEFKVSYAHVKSIKDEIDGQVIQGQLISIQGIAPFRCSCGANRFIFSRYRSKMANCIDCNAEYEAE